MIDHLLDNLGEDDLDNLAIVEHLPSRDPYAANGQVHMERPITDETLAVFRASELRRERTGIHAKVEILFNNVPLRWSNFNTDKDGDRTTLANGAHAMLSPLLKEQYPKAAMKADLDRFCWRIWDTHLASQDAEMVAGDVDEPLHFLLKPYVIEGGGTIIFAPPARGKSYTLLAMAISIDAGSDTLWPVERKRKTLVINLERSASSLRRRLGMVNFSLGLDTARPLLLLNARGRSLLDIRDAVARTVDKHQVEFIALDSLSRAGMGSLTKDDVANATMDLLNALGPSWLAIGHTPRQNEDHVFGSQHYDAAADIGVKVLSQRRDNTLGVGLQIVKENDVGPTQIGTWAYEFDQHGLHEIRKARTGEFAVVESSQTLPVPDQMIEYLLDQDHGRASGSDIASALHIDRANASRILNKDERFVRLGQEGHTVFYGVKQRN